MQKGIILHKGQRYLERARDGYVYVYSEELAKQKQMVEIFPFKEDPPIELVELERENDGLEEKLDLMTKRQINTYARLEKSDKELRLTGKPDMVAQALDKLTWR
jgi:hypothetical protein